MSGESEEVGSHPALGGKAQLVAVQFVETRRVRRADGIENHELQHRRVRVLGRQDDNAGAQRRVRYGHKDSGIKTERQVHELDVPLAVGKFVGIPGGSVEFADHQSEVLRKELGEIPGGEIEVIPAGHGVDLVVVHRHEGTRIPVDGMAEIPLGLHGQETARPQPEFPGIQLDRELAAPPVLPVLVFAAADHPLRGLSQIQVEGYPLVGQGISNPAPVSGEGRSGQEIS